MRLQSSFLWRWLALGAALTLGLVTMRATSVMPPTFDELVTESTSVIHGRVTAVRSAYVDSPRGPVIKTFVTVAVSRTLKGSAADTVELQFLGGTVGDTTLDVEGMPKFKAGQEAIFFVGANGKTFSPLIAMGHGLYRIHHDVVAQRDYVTRENGAPLTSTEDVSQPLESRSAASVTSAPALTPADFENRIVATVQRQAANRTVQR